MNFPLFSLFIFSSSSLLYFSVWQDFKQTPAQYHLRSIWVGVWFMGLVYKLSGNTVSLSRLFEAVSVCCICDWDRHGQASCWGECESVSHGEDGSPWAWTGCSTACGASEAAGEREEMPPGRLLWTPAEGDVCLKAQTGGIDGKWQQGGWPFWIKARNPPLWYSILMGFVLLCIHRLSELSEKYVSDVKK